MRQYFLPMRINIHAGGTYSVELGGAELTIPLYIAATPVIQTALDEAEFDSVTDNTATTVIRLDYRLYGTILNQICEYTTIQYSKRVAESI